MTSGPSQHESNESIIEELTAYLDGELEGEAIDQVEKRLSEDPAYLAQMQALQQTWDLLDKIPDAEPGSSFTQTTMELIATEAAKVQKKSAPFWRWPLRVAILLALPALVFALTSGMIRSQQQLPDRILVEDLSVVSHYELYQIARNDSQFVDGLMGRFVGAWDLEDTSGQALKEKTEKELALLIRGGAEELRKIPGDMDSRSQFIAQLSKKEKLQLKSQLERYLELEPSERQELKEFDRETRAREDASARLIVMHRYRDWLRDQEPSIRAAIRGQLVGEVLALIDADADKKRRAALDGMPSCDQDLIFDWLDETCADNERAIRKRFLSAVTEYVEKKGGMAPAALRKNANNGALLSLINYLNGLDRNFVETTLFDSDPDYFNSTFQALTSDTRQRLRPLDSGERRKTIMSWIIAVSQSKLSVTATEVYAFKETLSAEQRKQLEKLPPQQHFVELNKLYLKKRFPELNDLNELMNQYPELRGYANF